MSALKEFVRANSDYIVDLRLEVTGLAQQLGKERQDAAAAIEKEKAAHAETKKLLEQRVKDLEAELAAMNRKADPLPAEISAAIEKAETPARPARVEKAA